MKSIVNYLFVLIFASSAFGFRSDSEDLYVVYIFLHESCRISQYYTPELAQLNEEFGGDQIEFAGIFPGSDTEQEDIDIFAKEYGITFYLQKDDDQRITNAYNATVTPEVIVVNKSHRTVVYQGRIDNSYFRVGKKRQVVTTHELRDVLEQIRDGKEVDIESQDAIGCIIQKS